LDTKLKLKTVHQFHSGSAYGDGVTNSLFFTRKLLRNLGFQSEIYVEHIAKELSAELKPYQTYIPSVDQALLIHHSFGHNLTDWIVNLPDRKILVYHNITPEHFFPEGSVIRTFIQNGRKQTRLFRKIVDAAIAVSPFNAAELKTLGYDNVFIVPLLIDIQRIRSAAWNYENPCLKNKVFTILFVGRISANKCQHHLVEILRQLLPLINSPAQLVLVGGFDKNDQYYLYMKRLIHSYNLSDTVKITGKVSDQDLYSWYRVADVFLCMSEHEGFCIPLIEAMLFDVPVIAYNSSNIPYTLNGAGILVKEKNFDYIAELISNLSKDSDLKKAILKGQKRRVNDFLPQFIQQALAYVLEHICIELPTSWPLNKFYRYCPQLYIGGNFRAF
jgi:glycosyltransferase involved in cell wall biosynthesis